MRGLQTVESLVGAVREGDYAFRGRHARGDDAYSGAMRELNALGATLREQRLAAMEASALLDEVMRGIDVAVFAFDRERILRLANPAGARLLGRRAAGAVGSTAAFAPARDGGGPGDLSRQIAEAHGGSLDLQPPREGRGCVARPWLPRRGA